MQTGTIDVRCSCRTPELAGRTLALVMAGGTGSRLRALTRWDAKPALPFGGHYRNVDFALSNAVNSGIRRIALLTQYKAHSLIEHVQQAWSFLRPELGEFIQVWPAQQRRNAKWYAGTADSVYQNIDLIERLAPDRVLILAADHIYRMDYLAMLEAHVAMGLGATIGCMEVPLASARDFGVLATDAGGRVRYFVEKPSEPLPVPARPDAALASMGIYVFDRDLLLDCLHVDAEDPSSSHDFGRDVLPMLIRSCSVGAFPFRDPKTGRPGYWRDVGTLDSYWQANLDLVGESPELDLYDRAWPIHTQIVRRPAPRFVGAGNASRSIVAAGCTIAGSVVGSVLSPDCVVEYGAVVTGSVVLPDARIGRGCQVSNAIVGPGCTLPDGLVIGEDRQADAALCDVTPESVVLVTRETLERRGSSRTLRVA